MQGEAKAGPRDRWALWHGLPLVLAVALAVAGTTRFRLFYADDAMISLRYADRLLRGLGLTWTDGEWVEGYSNLAWVLLTAALGALGLELVMATRVLGVVALAGLVFGVSLRSDGALSGRRALSAGLFVAGTAGFGVWAVGGLSQTLVCALGVGMLQATRRLRIAAGDRVTQAVWMGLAAWATLNRIDGFVLVAIVVCAAWVGGLDWRNAARGVAACGVAWLAQLGFRIAYYGDPVPNTMRVKVGHSLSLAKRGVDWVGDGLWDNAPVVAVAVVAVLLGGRRSRDVAVAILGYLAFLIYVGGDIFMGHRLLLPALALCAVAVGDLAERSRWAALGLACLALLHGTWTASADPANTRPTRRTWVFRTKGPADVLREAFGQHDPLMAVDAAGATPFYTRFRAVDMLGLTDRYLATHPPPGWGKGAIGHDLGDGDYIWGRKPDILLFRSGLGGRPSFLSGRQMAARPDFAHTYGHVVIADRWPGGERAELWIRKRDSALGYRRGPGQIGVPGWFLGKWKRPALWRDGHLGPVFPAGTHAVAVELPRGPWTVELRGDGPIVPMEPTFSHGGGTHRVRFRVDAPTQLREVGFRRPSGE